MTRSRDFSKILGRSITNDTFSATGSITPLSVTSYDYDSAGQLQALNNSSLVDGSLHYLSKTKQLYVWDDSDNSYYPIDQSASALPEPYKFQGTVSGYASGGHPPARDIIEKFSFTSDANATDVGNLLGGTYGPAGNSSSTHGYASGGRDPVNAYSNVIQKFSFTVDENATDVGDLTTTINLACGNSSEFYGYVSTGWSDALPPPGNSNIIEKFPFATDTNATDVGDAIATKRGVSGQSSTTHGYHSGGLGAAYTTDINKFPFATDANATDVGDTTGGRGQGTGQSSTTNGYTAGGIAPTLGPPAYTNALEKFPFATDTNASDVGDLSTAHALVPAGQSSTSSGYTSGGNDPTAGGDLNVIDKFPFATDANATDVGDLTLARRYLAGHQV